MTVVRLRNQAVLVTSFTLALLPAAACQRPEPIADAAQVAAGPCLPLVGTLPSGSDARVLAGDYRLTLVATSGPRSGDSTSGALQLTAYPGGDRSGAMPTRPGATRYPLHGSTGIDLVRVGATAPGQTSSTDPSRPGALVIDWTAPDSPASRTIAIRLGSEANRTDVTPIDPAYTTLTVVDITPGRFTGRWESGLQGQRVTGYFCADRATG